MDNIYPDKSNDKFDIQYAPLLGLSSDIRASFGLAEDGGSPVIKTPDDNSTGHLRFGVAAEDAVAIQNRSFDLNGAYSFQLTQLGNKQFLVDPPNGLYQLGAVPVPGSDSGLSYTYLEIDDTDKRITLQAPEGIVLPGYGYGNHSGTYTKFLAVDIGGNMIEVDAAGGGYTNLTQFVDQNNWKVFYSDGNGDVQELSIGASGDVLTSNGTSSAPSWQTPTGGGSVTADNGLTMSTATNVQLGGTLLHNTTINGGSNMLILTSAVAGADQTLVVDNTGTGKAINATSIDDIGIQVTTANTYAINASSTAANAFIAATQAGKPITGAINAGTNNGVSTVIDLLKGGATTPADGIGMGINFTIENTTGGLNLANQIISKWAIAAEGTRTSQLDITGVNSAVTGTIMSAHGSGVVGIGISSSYTATRLEIVDNSVTDDAIVLISSTSTGAASNSQTGLNVSLSGVNANNNQFTIGVAGSNSHTGTGSTNVGVYGGASGGSLNYGVYGSGTTNGVRGVSDVTGVEGNTTQVDGIGVYGENSGGGVAVRGLSYDGRGGEFQDHNQSAANTINEVLRLVKTAGSGGGADGIGLSVDFYLQTSAGVGNIDIASKIISKYTTANAGTRNSSLIFQGVLSASTVDVLTLAGDGSVKLRPITATAASAITPVDGMIVKVNSTNGTFTAVGFWGYDGTNWTQF